ncbi:MAG: PKD domain-containing protein, partial [Candidatus Bathyarchaeota archaeon]|nr:PKD domain-containing protein [Candidatus Bathyarchaeota archaeon]
MKKIFVLTLVVLLLLVFASSIVYAAPTTTCTVNIYRVERIDPIENFLEGEADWFYKISVTDDVQTQEITFNNDSYDGNDTVIFNQFHQFTVQSVSVVISIYLYEDDGLLGYEEADISGNPSRASMTILYDLGTGQFTTTDLPQADGAYYKASGDFDGSTGIDQNDANLWFSITDNYQLPVANAGPDRTVVSGVKINFDGSVCTASAGSEIVTYQWDFENDGLFDAQGIQTSYTFPQQGTYVLALKVTDNFGRTSTDLCFIYVNSPPVALFSFSPTEPEVRDMISFTDGSMDPDGTVTAWYWQFGDGGSSNERHPTHQYSTNGTYLVRLTVTDDDGAQDTMEFSVTVTSTYELPVANAGADKTISTGERVNFDGSASTASTASMIETYQWDFDGDGVFDAEGVQTSFAYTETGTFTVVLKVTDDYDETSTDTCVVVVTNAPPTSQFTFSPSKPTILDTVNFSETASDVDGTLTSWSWDFGDGTTSEERNPSHQYAQKGEYTVMLTVTDNNGEQDTQTTKITVENLEPTADFDCATAKLIAGETVQFTDDSTDPEDAIVSYLWDFGDGYTSTNKDSTHKFETAGTYHVTLTVTDDEGATDAVSKPFTIVDNAVPVASFECDVTAPVAGDEIVFDESSQDQDGTIVSWSWDFGDGTTSHDQNPSHTYEEAGTYTVTLTVIDDLGAQNTYTMNLEVEQT